MTYWSAAVGPYVWHEFARDRVEGELRRMRTFGVRTVRIHLPWDVFMPSPRGVPPERLRQLETVLGIAERESLRVMPVLLAQSFGDCVMLPAYAIDVSAPRRGVRVLTDAVVQPGGPRDQYTDSLMLDAAMTWIEHLLRAFAGHVAIHSWDIGHDPATTMRPRRIEHMRTWAATLAQRIHEDGERCVLTLGYDDVLTGRGVRPGVLAPHLDACGLAFDAPSDLSRVVFIAQLMQRLTDAACPLFVHIPVGQPHERLATQVADCIAGLVDVGCAGVFAPAWADAPERVWERPPLDTHAHLGRRGLVTSSGDATLFGDAWQQTVASEMASGDPQPWPQRLDVDDYYANLPDSAGELEASWRGGQHDIPAMLN